MINTTTLLSGVVKDISKNSTLQFEWLAPFDIKYQHIKQFFLPKNSLYFSALTIFEIRKCSESDTAQFRTVKHFN